MTGDVTPEPVTESDDALERILSETPPLDLSDLPDLAAVTDLVDLDRLLAETAVPLDDATVIGTVAEVLGRD